MVTGRIVVATDLTARSDRALQRAAALADARGARLCAVHAVEQTFERPDVPVWRNPLDPIALARARLRSDLEGIAKDAEIVVERGTAASLVLDVAADGTDFIVTGVARDEFLGTAKLGATVEELARRSPVPLLVVKTRPHGSYRRIVVASDFSPASRAALDTALVACAGARITLFHGFEIPFESYATDRTAFRESGRANADAEAHEHLRQAQLARKDIEVVTEYGRPAQLLADMTRATDVDLVVVGRGRGRFAAFLLGSVSRAVLAQVPTDVMLVPPRATDT